MLLYIKEENKIVNIDNLTSINKYDYEDYFSIIYNLVSVRMIEVQYESKDERDKKFLELLSKLDHITI